MAAPDPPPLTVVRPGEGRSGDLGSITVDFKLFGADTGGALAVVEHGFPPGADFYSRPSPRRPVRLSCSGLKRSGQVRS